MKNKVLQEKWWNASVKLISKRQGLTILELWRLRRKNKKTKASAVNQIYHLILNHTKSTHKNSNLKKSAIKINKTWMRRLIVKRTSILLLWVSPWGVVKNFLYKNLKKWRLSKKDCWRWSMSILLEMIQVTTSVTKKLRRILMKTTRMRRWPS